MTGVRCAKFGVANVIVYFYHTFGLMIIPWLKFIEHIFWGHLAVKCFDVWEGEL